MTSLTNDAVSLCSAVNQLKFMILFVETFKIINFEVNYIQDFYLFYLSGIPCPIHPTIYCILS